MRSPHAELPQYALASSHNSGTRPGSIYPPRLSGSIRFKVERLNVFVAHHNNNPISTHRYTPVSILTYNSIQAIQIFSNAPSTPVTHTLTYILILGLMIRFFIHNFTNHITKPLN